MYMGAPTWPPNPPTFVAPGEAGTLLCFSLTNPT
jgi:hypothetical protein